MKLVVNRSGVYLDGRKVERCTRIDIANIDPVKPAEVMIHVDVDEISVDHKAPDA